MDKTCTVCGEEFPAKQFDRHMIFAHPDEDSDENVDENEDESSPASTSSIQQDEELNESVLIDDEEYQNVLQDFQVSEGSSVSDSVARASSLVRWFCMFMALWQSRYETNFSIFSCIFY